MPHVSPQAVAEISPPLSIGQNQLIVMLGSTWTHSRSPGPEHGHRCHSHSDVCWCREQGGG